MKTVRKILLYTGLALVALLIIAVALVFFYKDRIIKQFIEQANTHLNTPIKVNEITVSLFENFPQLSIVMTDVYVEDSHPGEYPLLTAAKISFEVNAFDVWSGNYKVEGLRITDSETSLKINEKGKSNYNILKDTSTGSTSQSVSFALEQVTLQNTKVLYIDRTAGQQMAFQSADLTASISISEDIYEIHAEGQITTETLSINGKSYSSGKSFVINSNLTYDDIKKHISIEPSTLQLKNSAFSVSGTYSWKDVNNIDLKFEGTDTDIQTIFSLFPESVYKRFERYRSKGDVYFNGRLKGVIGESKAPSLSIDFGFIKSTLYHPDYKSEITDASMKGSFATSDVTNTSVATLVLKDIEGVLNGEEFKAAFVLSNFNDPDLICSFKGKVDAAALAEFFPVENISQVSGSLMADVSLEGKVGLLKKRATAQKVRTQGTIDMESINMLVGKNRVPVKDLKGSLQFSNNDLALSNVSGAFGSSDFLLNGFFKNVITYLLFEDQPVGIETDLKARFVDLDQLFDIGYGSNPKSSASQNDNEATYKFNISKNVYLNFNCDVKRLRYKRFYAQNINGDLLVKNQVAVSRNLSLKTMGGSLNLSGIVDATNNKAIDVVCTSHLKDIHLDSVFYVFQNFDQSFIEDRHLKGQVTADINFELTLDQNLKLFSETLTADIGAVIRNGELNNFEPMKKLNKYLDDEGLSKLRFSDLQNEIHIENKTVYIPQMQVRSNVTAIRVSGTHTFNQRIDYRLITPLRNKNKLDATSINAIEEDGSGQSKLFLKITGTTDNYKVAYDTEAVKKKIANDLKQEVKELKDAFRNKGTQQKKEQELEKDEYFDW